MNLFQKLFGQDPPPEPVSPSPPLTPTRWKTLLDQSWSGLLSQRLGLAWQGDWYWAGPWEDHRRRVFRVWLQRGCTCGTFQWGWNLDFVPHLTSRGLGWHRTVKSVGLELFRVPESYIDTDRDRSSVMAGERRGLSSEEAVRERDRLLLVQFLPQIEDYYRRTASLEGLLAEVEALQELAWYRFTNGPQLYIDRAFLLAALGRREEAEGVIRAIPWRDNPLAERQRGLLLERLAKQEPL